MTERIHVLYAAVLGLAIGLAISWCGARPALAHDTGTPLVDRLGMLDADLYGRPYDDGMLVLQLRCRPGTIVILRTRYGDDAAPCPAVQP